MFRENADPIKGWIHDEDAEFCGRKRGRRKIGFAAIKPGRLIIDTAAFMSVVRAATGIVDGS
jgi:hypothetical protein